jgi:hypothetical protein
MPSDVVERRCFVICPIGSEGSEERAHSDSVFKHLIEPAARQCGYTAERSSDSDEPGMITSQIIERLTNDPLVIADLSFQNANVFYELAVRHAARMPVVILCDRNWNLPFDISDARAIRFQFAEVSDPMAILDNALAAREHLISQIKFVESSGGEVDNPISSSIDLLAMRKGTQQEQRDAMIFERFERLSADVQMLSDSVRHIQSGNAESSSYRRFLAETGLSGPLVPAVTPQEISEELLDKIASAIRAAPEVRSAEGELIPIMDFWIADGMARRLGTDLSTVTSVYRALRRLEARNAKADREREQERQDVNESETRLD